jgi:hypothetical protein
MLSTEVMFSEAGQLFFPHTNPCFTASILQTSQPTWYRLIMSPLSFLITSTHLSILHLTPDSLVFLIKTKTTTTTKKKNRPVVVVVVVF